MDIDQLHEVGHKKRRAGGQKGEIASGHYRIRRV